MNEIHEVYPYLRVHGAAEAIAFQGMSPLFATTGRFVSADSTATRI
jgi:hypothetical protein